MKSIGIIGGMGASASARWYEVIIKMMQDKYGATQDNEFPEIFLFNLKLDGWSERGVEDDHLVQSQMYSAIRKMNLLKPDVVIMACNTIHKFHNKLQGLSKSPILNMIHICKEKIKADGFKKAGVLCSDTTRKEKLYGEDCVYCTDEEQESIDDIILLAQGGRHHIISTNDFSGRLKNRGADCVIVGCTELPLVLKQETTSTLPVFDAGYILLDKLTDEINDK